MARTPPSSSPSSASTPAHDSHSAPHPTCCAPQRWERPGPSCESAHQAWACSRERPAWVTHARMARLCAALHSAHALRRGCATLLCPCVSTRALRGLKAAPAAGGGPRALAAADTRQRIARSATAVCSGACCHATVGAKLLREAALGSLGTSAAAKGWQLCLSDALPRRATGKSTAPQARRRSRKRVPTTCAGRRLFSCSIRS